MPRLGGSAEEIFIHTYTHVQTSFILLIRSQVDCSLKVWRVGGSGAAAAGCCNAVSLTGLGSLKEPEPVMLPVCNTVIILSTALLLGSVWVVETCLINSAVGEVLTSCQWFPALIVCVCVCVCVCEWLPAFAVECDLWWSLWFTLCSLLLLV